jgi:DNA-binding NtrC family response regulator
MTSSDGEVIPHENRDNYPTFYLSLNRISLWRHFIGKVFSTASMQRTAMKDKKVLIIDDEVDFGILMEAFFFKKGCKVFVANSITTGLGLLQQVRPDYLLLDNNLPDGLGWSKTDFILTNYPLTELILISALEVPKTSSSTFRIIQKPLLKDELNLIFK